MSTTTGIPTTDATDLGALRSTVQARYGEAARRVAEGQTGASCCGPASESSGCCGSTTESWDPITANLYDEGEAAGVPAVRRGGPGRAADAACRQLIADAGWGDAFLHGTGHGVGLDIHESPRVAANAAGSLADGHVVTVEPGVYLAEHGGVRIEDTLVVADEGSRTLTLAPKDPTL